MKRILFILIDPWGLASCHVGRTIIWNYAADDDYDKFSQLAMAKSGDTVRWHFTETGNQALLKKDSLSSKFLQGIGFYLLHRVEGRYNRL